MYKPISTLWNRFIGLPAHDPMDWRAGPGATSWYTDTYCSNCKGWTEHRDRMAGICHACGSRKGVRSYRSSRRIWTGRNWALQHKYGDGPNDFDLVYI